MPADTLLNGQPVDARRFSDRGLHFGDGLFETIAIVDAQACLWSRHLARLEAGCERLGLPCPDAGLLRDEMARLCTGVGRGVLKLILSAGATERGYARPATVVPNRWMHCSAWPEGELYNSERPLEVAYCAVRLGHQPLLSGIKHLNRLEQVMARRTLRRSADEGLLFDQTGDLVEAIAANVLVHVDGRWMTPALSGCGVAGVVRAELLEQAPRHGEQVRLGAISPAMLERSDQLYLTSSLLGVRRVGRLQGRSLPATETPDWLRQVHASCFGAMEAV